MTKLPCFPYTTLHPTSRIAGGITHQTHQTERTFRPVRAFPVRYSRRSLDRNHLPTGTA